MATECNKRLTLVKQDFESSNLQYYLLSAANPPAEYVSLHNKAFKFWMRVIEDAFKETNNDSSHLHADFMRQNVIGCLCSEGEVVATLLHSFSSVLAEAARSYSYLQNNYPEGFFHELKRLNINNVTTIHYLAVHPEWRKKNQSIHVAPIMLGLAQRIRDEYEQDALIGVYRRDRKVHEMAYALGGDCVIANVQNHNTPCDLIVMNKTKPYQHPVKEISQQISKLWQNRIDTFKSTNKSARKAA